MAELPDPTATLKGAERAAFERMAAARAAADGRSALGQVYVRMFNNPGVAEKVGALGEQIRFHGVLPDEVRESVILHVSVKKRYGYEWSHHQRPAKLAGLTPEELHTLTEGKIPASLPDAAQAALETADAVLASRSIPAGVQQRVVNAYGTAGTVEIVVLCGLYTIMGFMVSSFDIPLEPNMPKPPF
jgi:4-carboxymuconolactone decarboxylase